MKKIKFYEESSGKTSSMRIMCFLSLFASFVWTAMLLKDPSSITIEAVMLDALYVVGAFAPKAVQKYAEKLN